jgi:hypothetical protein
MGYASRPGASRFGTKRGIRDAGKKTMGIVTEPLFLLSAAAVLVAVLAPVLLASRKNFTYAVLYDGMFEVEAEADGEDSPDNEQAARERVRVVAVELKNSSGLNIERSHYARPITVGFGEGGKVLDAEVVEEEPSGLGVTLRGVPERDPERVALGPVLFKDGNAVLLEAVVAGSEPGEVEVDSRMVGIDRIAQQRRGTVGKRVLDARGGEERNPQIGFFESRTAQNAGGRIVPVQKRRDRARWDLRLPCCTAPYERYAACGPRTSAAFLQTVRRS